MKFKNENELVKFASDQTPSTNLNITDIKVIAEYIHLDKEERRLFSSNNHEYLITQVQSSLNNAIENFTDKYNEPSVLFQKQRHKIDLRFTYPVKELFGQYKI